VPNSLGSDTSRQFFKLVCGVVLVTPLRFWKIGQRLLRCYLFSHSAVLLNFSYVQQRILISDKRQFCLVSKSGFLTSSEHFFHEVDVSRISTSFVSNLETFSSQKIIRNISKCFVGERVCHEALSAHPVDSIQQAMCIP